MKQDPWNQVVRNGGANRSAGDAAGTRQTARQQEQGPNSEKTAEQSNEESASLYLHSHLAGGRAKIPIGSGAAIATPAGFQSHPTFARPPDGRHSTAMAGTATPNGSTETRTEKRRRALTAWELPELIRPQPLRRRRQGRAAAMQPFYLELAVFFYTCRYATASMALRRFPELLQTERTAQRHLANMVAHGLIAAASTRGTSPNFPFVYFLTEKGIRFVKAQLPNGDAIAIPATEERRSRGQSLHSLIHELFVSEFSVMLENTVRSRGDLRLPMQERRYFRRNRRLKYRDGETNAWIEPDFGFLPAMIDERGARKVLPMHFVEMELGTHNVAKIRDKLTAYDRWAVQEGRDYLRKLYERHGEQNANNHFRLLLIASDPYGYVGDTRRLLDLFVQAIELPPKMRDRIWLCTAADLKAYANEKTPLSAAVWFRAKDSKRWTAEFRDMAANARQTAGKRSYTRQRRFVNDRLSKMRRHVLFPD